MLMFTVKRCLDIAAASLLFLLAAPIMLLLSVLVFFDLEGFPVYVQQRIGRKGNIFLIYKFRTMVHDAHANRPAMVGESNDQNIIYKFEEDRRVTRFGTILRKYSFDELPQLLNVLKGDMSLVGPRPFSVEIFEQGICRNPELQQWMKERHQVRPGMTGLWQVSGRNNLPGGELIRLDLEYVRNWTLRLDFEILLRTLPAVIRGEGAY